jgi:hypothetical protein
MSEWADRVWLYKVVVKLSCILRCLMSLDRLQCDFFSNYIVQQLDSHKIGRQI